MNIFIFLIEQSTQKTFLQNVIYIKCCQNVKLQVRKDKKMRFKGFLIRKNAKKAP